MHQHKSAAGEERHFGHGVEAGGFRYPEASISPTKDRHALSSAARSCCKGNCPFPTQLPVRVNSRARGTGEGMLARVVHCVQSCPADDMTAASTSQCCCVTCHAESASVEEELHLGANAGLLSAVARK